MRWRTEPITAICWKGGTGDNSVTEEKVEKQSQQIEDFDQLLELLNNTFNVELNENIDVSALQKRWENLP